MQATGIVAAVMRGAAWQPDAWVMTSMMGWEALWLPLVVLAGMALVLFALAVVRLHASIAPAKATRRPRARAGGLVKYHRQ